MELLKKSLGRWLVNILTFIVGILLIVAGAKYSSATGAMDAISMLLGITLIIISSISLILSFLLMVVVRKGFAASGILSGLLLSLGIWFVSYKTASSLILPTISLLPIVLIVLGVIFLIDSIDEFCFHFRFREMEFDTAHAITLTCISLASIILGILCVVKREGGLDTLIPTNVQLILFGIVMMVEALFRFLTTLSLLPSIRLIRQRRK